MPEYPTKNRFEDFRRQVTNLSPQAQWTNVDTDTARALLTVLDSLAALMNEIELLAKEDEFTGLWICFICGCSENAHADYCPVPAARTALGLENK